MIKAKANVIFPFEESLCTNAIGREEWAEKLKFIDRLV